MTLNINRQIDDVYYRYKMPKLLAKVEGKGNGIKTVIVNMSDIAKSLYRKPSYSTKFFGFELGAQINLDEKNDRYIVNGCHDAGKLQELLHAFIKKFVLCQSCGNPETSLIARRTGLWAKCRACGFSDQLDPTHRLTQYIMKNPPETEAEGALVEDRSTKKTDESVRTIDNESEDSLILIDRLTIGEEDCKQLSVEQQRAIEFHEFVENLFNRREIVPMRQAVEKRATELGLGPGFVVIVMEIVFCNRDTLIEDVELYRVLFQYLSRRGPRQRVMQEFVLAGMEQLLVSMNIVGKSCHFVKALYDSDVVEEDAILKWFNKGPNANNVPIEMSSQILKECSKMVEWLQKADEESD